MILGALNPLRLAVPALTPEDETGADQKSRPSDGDPTQSAMLDIVDAALGESESSSDERTAPGTDDEIVSQEQDRANALREESEQTDDTDDGDAAPSEAGADTVEGADKPPTEEAPKPKDKDEESTDADPGTGDDTELTSKELGYMRASTRRKVKSLMEQNTQLAPKAQAAEQLHKYLTESGIEKAEFNDLMQLGAALKAGDFQAFLQGVQPYVQMAQEATGHVLPADLQAQVDQGAVTVDAAKAYAQQRTAANLEQVRLRRTNEQLSQERQRASAERVQAQAQALAAAADGWEAKTARSDPDYARKKDAVHRYTQAAIARPDKPPATARDVEAILDQALKDVNQTFGASRHRGGTPTSPDSTRGNSGGSRPEPASMMDAVNGALTSMAG